MGVEAIGTLTANGFGTEKSNREAITDESTQIDAAQYNRLKRAVVELQEAVGTNVSPDGDSLEGRIVALEDAEIDLADGDSDGLMSSADFTKLAGIATGATANATNAQLRDRSTHTGTQAISTVTNLQTTLDGKAPKKLPVTSQNTTHYVLDADDAETLVLMTSASDKDVLVPANADVPYDIGTTINICWRGAGVTTITPDTEVTVDTAGGKTLVLHSENAVAVLVKIDTNTWLAKGELA